MPLVKHCSVQRKLTFRLRLNPSAHLRYNTGYLAHLMHGMPDQICMTHIILNSHMETSAANAT